MKCKKKNIITLSIMCFFVILVLMMQSCTKVEEEKKEENINVIAIEETEEETTDDNPILHKVNDKNCVILEARLNGDEKYADMSEINDGYAFLYVVNDKDIKKDFTVTVNAGHGVKGGSQYKTYSHPDMTPKLTGGSNKIGEVYSMAISEGMAFNNGDSESGMNLKVAMLLKDRLLDEGYNVLMIREDGDSRLDNIARTVLANNYSDIHVSLHFDSTETDKGAFVILPFNDKRYLSMEPVCYHYEDTNVLGDCIIDSFVNNDVKVWKDGKMYMDLTQISYSTIPTVDIELGDKNTLIDDEKIESYVKGIIGGINKYRQYEKNVYTLDENIATESEIDDFTLDENMTTISEIVDKTDNK